MSHLKFNSDAPGIIAPMLDYPHSAKPLNELAEALLVNETAGLTKKDRELIASYVSYHNDCIFCSESHGAVADYLSNEEGKSRKIWENEDNATQALSSLLKIAKKVTKSPKEVSQSDIKLALDQGYSEREVHDTILIAAAFCMFNRYVDALGTKCPPRGDKSYLEMGEMLAENGYGNALK